MPCIHLTHCAREVVLQRAEEHTLWGGEVYRLAREFFARCPPPEDPMELGGQIHELVVCVERIACDALRDHLDLQ